MIHRIWCPGGVILSGFFLLVAALPLAASDERIPPDSWVYPALRKFELMGVVSLEPTMPYTRRELERYVERVTTAIEQGRVDLTPRQRFLLERLREEFEGKALLPREREDRPVLVYGTESGFFSFDITAGGSIRKEPDGDRGVAEGLLVPGLLIDIDEKLTLETTYRVRINREEDRYRDGESPSPRERSWRGVTAEYERAYAAFGGRSWNVFLGRDYGHWASGRTGGLLLSRTAGTLDHISFDLTIGALRIHTVQVLLDPSVPRRMAGHRLTIRLPRGIYLGFGESVIYTGRDIDFAYLIPLCSYYANQYNEKRDDNVLWSLDWKIPFLKGLMCCGEVLVDDFQYESDPPAPNKWGFNCFLESQFVLGQREVELFAGYTFIDIYTYTHRDSLLTHYVTGDGDVTANRIIGSSLGPDADRWMFGAAIPISSRFVAALEGNVSRYGEGNDMREWMWDGDPNPRTPSGDVLHVKDFEIIGFVDLGAGSSISARGGLRYVSGGSDDVDTRDVFGSLEVLWDF